MKSPAHKRAIPHEAQVQVEAAQVAHLYGHSALAQGFNLVNGLILVIVEWGLVPSRTLSIWFACLLVVTTGRGVLAYLYRRYGRGQGETQRWYLLYVLGVFAAGSVWGAAALYLFPADAVGYQLFLIMILAGMTAGAVAVLAHRMAAFLAFMLPVLIPLSVRLYLEDGPITHAMSAVTLLYLVGMTVAAKALNRIMLDSLILRFDNRELVKEIRDREQAEQALCEEKERLQTTLEALSEGVAILHSDGTIGFLNPAAEQLCGRSGAAAVGQSMDEVFPRFDERTRQLTETAVARCLRLATRCEDHTLLVAPDDRERIIEEVVSPLRDHNGSLIGAVAVLRDITHAREHSQQLAYQASHDALTQLPNRTLLWDRLNHAIEKATRAHRVVAVLFMDLDRFKTVNDSLGHAMGDALLKTVAERLRASLREEDTVARLGGDEFVIVLEDVLHEGQVTATAHKILHRFSRCFVVNGHELFVTASVGVSLFPRDGSSAESLLKNADIAMYRAKEHGRNDVCFYAQEMRTHVHRRHNMEQQLHHAISRGQLELHYQPRLELKTGRIVSAEALVRWHHPQNGTILPSEFIPVAEESGAILDIGEWVLTRACRQVQEWHARGYPMLRVAVNLSACQIRQHGFPARVASILNDRNLEAKYLELEITESLFLSEVDEVIATLGVLKSQGLKLAIDDFGTGYSSLSYLKRFPIDVLKIDRSFVQDVTDSSSDAAIVASIIAMARGLNLAVIAEGVETRAQLDFLRQRGCDGFQGFYFSRALPAGEMTALLHANREQI